MSRPLAPLRNPYRKGWIHPLRPGVTRGATLAYPLTLLNLIRDHLTAGMDYDSIAEWLDREGTYRPLRCPTWRPDNIRRLCWKYGLLYRTDKSVSFTLGHSRM